MPAEARSRSPGRPRKKRDDGFTLIEVTVAVAMLGVLTVSTLMTLIPISRQNQLSREMNLALTEVRDVLERMQSTPFNELLETYPPGAVIPVDGLEDGDVTVSYEDPTADPLVIQLDLVWRSSDQGELTRTFFTVRTL